MSHGADSQHASKSFAIEVRRYSPGKMAVTLLYAEVLLLMVASFALLVALEFHTTARKEEWKIASLCVASVFSIGFVSFIRWARRYYRPIPCPRMDDLFFRILRVVLFCMPVYLVFGSTFSSSARGVVVAIEVFFVLLHINYLIACLGGQCRPPRFIVTGLILGLLAIPFSSDAMPQIFSRFR